MATYRIFKKAVAAHAMLEGHELVKVEKNIKNNRFFTYLFLDTPEFREFLSDFYNIK